ncbi:MAG: PQQ-binding-like beta-propeller repeat protein, partial [Thermoproteota archaeon]
MEKEMRVTRRRVLLLLLFTLITLVLLAPPRALANLRGLADTPWPMFMHDLQHTGRSPYLGAQTNNTRWRFQTGGWIVSSPAIGYDGTIYVGS